MLMITYCFFFSGICWNPRSPRSAWRTRNKSMYHRFYQRFALFFFFLFPTSFWRMLYSPLIVGWSIAKNPREQLRGKLILLREVLASLSRKIPERNQVTFAQQKSLLKECLLHSTIYLISFFKGAPGIFGTPGGDGDSGLAVSIYFFLPISSGKGGG